MDDKVYTPEIVPENPFPGGVEPVISQTPIANGNYTPTVTQSTKVPKKKVAQELLSSALNTRSKKVLQEFELQQSGGFKIGDYREGISGDLRLTPSGIVARNIAGLTTVAIDGETGDAIYAGELRSGTLITGDILVDGGTIQVSGDNGYTVLDDVGLVSNSRNFLTTETFSSALNQSFTTTSYADVTGSSTTIVLPRTCTLQFFIQCNVYLVESVGNTGDGIVVLDIDGNINNNCAIWLNAGNNQLRTMMSFTIRSLEAGSHTIKLKGKFVRIYAGAPIMTVRDFSWSYLILGT